MCGGLRPLRPDLAEALLLHSWPLNVRGLANAVKIAAIASPGEALELGTEVRGALEAGEAISAAAGSPDQTVDPEWPEDAQIHARLESSGGRVASAARALGLSRQQVYRWLQARGRTADDYR